MVSAEDVANITAVTGSGLSCCSAVVEEAAVSAEAAEIPVVSAKPDASLGESRMAYGHAGFLCFPFLDELRPVFSPGHASVSL